MGHGRRVRGWGALHVASWCPACVHCYVHWGASCHVPRGAPVVRLICEHLICLFVAHCVSVSVSLSLSAACEHATSRHSRVCVGIAVMVVGDGSGGVGLCVYVCVCVCVCVRPFLHTRAWAPRTCAATGDVMEPLSSIHVGTRVTASSIVRLGHCSRRSSERPLLLMQVDTYPRQSTSGQSTSEPESGPTLIDFLRPSKMRGPPGTARYASTIAVVERRTSRRSVKARTSSSCDCRSAWGSRVWGSVGGSRSARRCLMSLICSVWCLMSLIRSVCSALNLICCSWTNLSSGCTPSGSGSNVHSPGSMVCSSVTDGVIRPFAMHAWSMCAFLSTVLLNLVPLRHAQHVGLLVG
jgi:hypothetical protein